MKSLRGKPRGIMFLGFNSLLSQQAAGNLTQERLNITVFIAGTPDNGFEPVVSITGHRW
jgi:hypothetical protein